MGDWIVELIKGAGYAGVAFLMLLETVFPPIPSEVIMPIAGIQAARGEMALWLVILSGTAGAMLGNTFWYLLARAIGLERFKPIIDRWGRWLTLDWAEVERAEHWFRRWDWLFVFVGRMLPTVRSLVSLPAGFSHMSLRRMLIWSTIGTAGWTAALTIAGYVLGSRYTQIDEYIGPMSTGILVALVLWYVYRVVTWKPSR